MLVVLAPWVVLHGDAHTRPHAEVEVGWILAACQTDVRPFASQHCTQLTGKPVPG